MINEAHFRKHFFAEQMQNNSVQLFSLKTQMLLLPFTCILSLGPFTHGFCSARIKTVSLPNFNLKKTILTILDQTAKKVQAELFYSNLFGTVYPSSVLSNFS